MALTTVIYNIVRSMPDDNNIIILYYITHYVYYEFAHWSQTYTHNYVPHKTVVSCLQTIIKKLFDLDNIAYYTLGTTLSLIVFRKQYRRLHFSHMAISNMRTSKHKLYTYKRIITADNNRSVRE